MSRLRKSIAKTPLGQQLGVEKSTLGCDNQKRHMGRSYGLLRKWGVLLSQKLEAKNYMTVRKKATARVKIKKLSPKKDPRARAPLRGKVALYIGETEKNLKRD
jgi:hypothetical protein